MQISALLMTYNEENNILRCVQSVLAVVDEIVVVDTGSTDKTISLIEGLSDKIKIYYHQWVDDFSTIRNYLINKASFDWCITIDADESLTKESEKIFRDIISELDQCEHKDRFLISCVIDNINDVAVDNIPRLFMRDSSTRYIGRVHEYVYKDNPILKSANQIRIIHTGYKKETLVSRDKLARNARLLALQLEESQDDLRWNYFNLRYVEEGSLEQRKILDRFKNVSLPYPQNHELYCLNVNLLNIKLLIKTRNFTYALYFIRKLLEHYNNLEVHQFNAYVEAELALLDSSKNLEKVMCLFEECKNKESDPYVYECLDQEFFLHKYRQIESTRFAQLYRTGAAISGLTTIASSFGCILEGAGMSNSSATISNKTPSNASTALKMASSLVSP
jgi:glycosyltransferase involved in cell wall biosynthesis